MIPKVTDHPSLIGGPYRTPRCKIGHDLPGQVLSKMEAVDGPHPVLGITDGPIPWPWTRVSGTRRQIIVTSELERAIRTESVQAVAHWWGASRTWAEQARYALGVPRMNPGTMQLWRELAVSRLGDSVHRGGYPGPRAKVTDIQVKIILRRIANGERRAALADEYGITRQYISLLISGRRRAKSGIAK